MNNRIEQLHKLLDIKERRIIKQEQEIIILEEKNKKILEVLMYVLEDTYNN